METNHFKQVTLLDIPVVFVLYFEKLLRSELWPLLPRWVMLPMDFLFFSFLLDFDFEKKGQNTNSKRLIISSLKYLHLCDLYIFTYVCSYMSITYWRNYWSILSFQIDSLLLLISRQKLGRHMNKLENHPLQFQLH